MQKHRTKTMHKNTVKKIATLYAKVANSSNGCNARRVRINKVATADEGNARRADVNVVTIANVMASDAKTGANIAVNANANKTASNIKKCMPMYQVT